MKKRIAAFVMAIVMMAGNGVTVHAVPERMEDGTLFDPDYYAETYPDLMRTFGRNTKKLYQHYKNYGKAEGRVALPSKYIYPELPAPASGTEYTIDELIAIYRNIVELNGITWDPTLKGNWDETIGQFDIFEWYDHDDNYNGSNWGTGFLEHWNIERAAYSSLESFAMGDTVGHPITSYYFEVLGWNDSMGMYEIIGWSAQ